MPHGRVIAWAIAALLGAADIVTAFAGHVRDRQHAVLNAATIIAACVAINLAARRRGRDGGGGRWVSDEEIARQEAAVVGAVITAMSAEPGRGRLQRSA